MCNLEIKDYNVYNFYIIMNSEDYKDIEDFSEGLAATKHNNGVCGYINKKGYETLLYEYNFVGNFKEGLALVQNKKGLYGYIDKEFNEVIECKYIYGTDFKYGYSIVRNNSLNLIINKKGAIIDYLEDDINIENISRILYKKKLINKKEYEECLIKTNIIETDIIKKIIPVPFSNLKTSSYYNMNDEKIIPYDNIENRNFSEDFVIIRIDKQDIRIFNKKGKQLKIHTCIIYDENLESEILEKINSFKYRISNMEVRSLASKITIDAYEYIIYALDESLLINKKIQVLNELKQIVSGDLIEIIDDKIKKLKQ